MIARLNAERGATLRVLGFVTMAITVGGSRPTKGAEHIRVTIAVDGRVVLRGTSGSDGRETCDQVWPRLKDVSFGETEAFAELGIRSAKAELAGANRGGVFVDMGRAGKLIRDQIPIMRNAEASDISWQIPPEFVDEVAGSRLVYRDTMRRESQRQLAWVTGIIVSGFVVFGFIVIIVIISQMNRAKTRSLAQLVGQDGNSG